MKRNSLFNCHSEHRVIEIRRHYYVYFLLADLVANLVSNYMALLAMDACGKDGYINIPPLRRSSAREPKIQISASGSTL